MCGNTGKFALAVSVLATLSHSCFGADAHQAANRQLLGNMVPACFGNISYSAFASGFSDEFGPFPSGVQICFERNEKVKVAQLGGGEGLADEGRNAVIEGAIQFSSSDTAEGWASMFKANRVKCNATFDQGWKLILTGCSDQSVHEPLEPVPHDL